MAKLPYSFYQKEGVVNLAILLLGKQLFTYVDGILTRGIIVQTEAYNRLIDKASHVTYRFYIKGNKFVSKPNS